MLPDRFRNLPSSILTLNGRHFPDSPKFLDHYDPYKQILTPKGLKTPRFQEKGLILVWPPKRRRAFYYNKELVWFTWILAHTLYWVHMINLFPSGSALPFRQPPWKWEAPLRKPENRDYIIEPDWNSRFV